MVQVYFHFNTDGVDGLSFEEFQHGLKIWKNIHLTRDDWELLTEDGSLTDADGTFGQHRFHAIRYQDPAHIQINSCHAAFESSSRPSSYTHLGFRIMTRNLEPSQVSRHYEGRTHPLHAARADQPDGREREPGFPGMHVLSPCMRFQVYARYSLFSFFFLFSLFPISRRVSRHMYESIFYMHARSLSVPSILEQSMT